MKECRGRQDSVALMQLVLWTTGKQGASVEFGQKEGAHQEACDKLFLTCLTTWLHFGLITLFPMFRRETLIQKINIPARERKAAKKPPL